MRIRTATVSPIVEAYSKLPAPPKDLPAITRLRGNAFSEVLLLVEHPTENEYAHNVPWCDQPALEYCRIMEQHEVDTDKFLVMPYSRFGAKASKASTEWTFPLLHEQLPKTRVKCVVVIGMHAFGFVFAGGRKTHAKTIIGNPMYLPQLHTLPVFVMPDSNLLTEMGSRDFRLANIAKDKAELVFNITLALKMFLTDKLQVKL